MKTKTALILIMLLLIQISYAQDLSQDFKNWYITGVNLRLSKKTTLKGSRLNSYDIKGYRAGFNQSTLGIAQRINKKWEIGGAYALSNINGSREKTTYHRLSLYASRRTNWHRFRMKNTAQVEKYFPIQPKFGARLVLTNKWSYVNKKWPLDISPYIKNQLYYYQGGKPIVYWLAEEDIETDVEEGEDIEESIEQAPNGWHRYRFSAGIRSKLSKQIALSIFYTKQIEFNTGLAPYRELNVYNKSQTRRKRPFNNYSLIGMSLVFTLKTY